MIKQVTGVASSLPFDNATNGFVSKDTQAAIEEARSFINNPILDQSYWVSKQGSDTTGNGSIGYPYLTIGKALSVITDASPTKRYSIFVGPGDYPESLSWKANVFTRGSGPIVTRITGSTQNINNTTWNVAAADNRSGWQDISLNGVATWDFTAQAGNSEGKLYLWNVRTSGAWTLTAQNAINQIIVRDTDFFGAWTQNGINAFISNSTFQSGAIAVNSAAAGGIPATLVIISGRITSNITATWTSNNAVTVNLAGVNIGASTVLTASGASCTVNVNDGSLPVPANRSFTSGAILNRINDNFARGLLSATTNVDASASAAPTAGQALIASNSTTAAWGYQGGTTILDFGDGSDGDVTISSGTTTLTRTMYYNNLTISSTGVLNPNGFKIYVKGTLTNSVTGGIIRTANNGNNSPGTTGATGGAALTANDMGTGSAGQNGPNGASGGLGGSAGVPGVAAGTTAGYGNAGANGGNGGSGTGGAAGTYTHVPERIIRHDHIYLLAYKIGGQGGASGAGGAASALGTGGGGGGGGAGGAVIMIFAHTLNNTGSFSARGGNGGNGNQGNGNATGGGGGGGGGGGQIYIICNVLTAIGTLTVTGGTGGSGGSASGGGGVGTAGGTGSTGRTTVLTASTNTWTVT